MCALILVVSRFQSKFHPSVTFSLCIFDCKTHRPSEAEQLFKYLQQMYIVSSKWLSHRHKHELKLLYRPKQYQNCHTAPTNKSNSTLWLVQNCNFVIHISLLSWVNLIRTRVIVTASAHFITGLTIPSCSSAILDTFPKLPHSLWKLSMSLI